MIGPINCRGKLLSFEVPKVMGIINVTPDSFYDGGVAFDTGTALDQAMKMVSEGAEILDIGAMSSRPNAQEISLQEEANRLMPVLKAIKNALPDTLISIDTYRSEVAKSALESGAHIINDISAGFMDQNIWRVCSEFDAPYIMMHMQGNPRTMQLNPNYDDVMLFLLHFFKQRITDIRKYGVKDIVIDPGFGFGKTETHNYQILKRLSSFSMFDLPILCGLSRKSMLYKMLGITPETALNATTAAHMIALQNGAQILRVHDVLEAKQSVDIWTRVREI